MSFSLKVFYRFLFVCVSGLIAQLVGCASHSVYPLQQQNITGYAKTSVLLDVPIVLQRDRTLSAVAVLESLSLYWHRPIFQDKMRMSHPPASRVKGYSVAEVTAIARRYEFDALVLKTDLAVLRTQIDEKRPVILELNVNDMPYYVLFGGYHNEGVWLMDPVKGMGFMANKDFISMWSASGNRGILLAPH